MNCFSFVALAAAVFAVPQIADAQTPTPIGNNQTAPGFYVEGLIGINSLNDSDFDNDSIDFTVKSKLGAVGALAAGYSIPRGSVNLRLEGELGVRGNKIDELEAVNGVVREGVDDAKTNAYSAMINAHADFYVLPNFALTVGAGVGYAQLKSEIVVDVDGVDTSLNDEDEDTDNVFAYQGRLGARYDFSGHSTISVGYTYFATDDATVEDNAGVEATFDYESHAFHAGYAYRF